MLGLGLGLIDVAVQSRKAGTTPTTWNAADKSADITLSGGNLVATLTAGGAGTYDSVRTVDGISGTMKVYWEVVLTTDANDRLAFGISNSSFSTTGTTIVGSVNAAGYRSADANLFINFVGILAGLTAPAAGNNVGFAVDFANHKIWTRVNGGNWDNTTDNPATNTGGGDISSITGTVFPTASIADANNVLTAQFSSASWSFAAPAGFSQLGH